MENILKQPMKIKTIKLQRKTHQENQKKKKEGNELNRFSFQMIENENEKYETKIINK
jgi:hypothetical protein